MFLYTVIKYALSRKSNAKIFEYASGKICISAFDHSTMLTEIVTYEINKLIGHSEM